MRDYVIINGVNSLTINGLAISKLPPISKPLMRNMKEEIDGRDGDIITELGYSAYDKTMEIGLYGNYDINEIISFFNGEGTITFSNEDDKHYYYKILEQIDYEKLLKFKTATITFHCQPFKYPNNEQIIDVDSLTVEGTGTDITLANTILNTPISTELLGDTIQNGTPTPESPIDVETVEGNQNLYFIGKNLIDMGTSNQDYVNAGSSGHPSWLSVNNNIISVVIQGAGGTVTYRNRNFIGNNTYTISSTFSMRYGRYYIRLRKNDNSGWQTNSDASIDGFTYNSAYRGWFAVIQDEGDSNITVNIPDCLYWQLGVGYSSSNIGTGTIQTISNLQLQKGTIATSFEEYKEQSYGKNLGTTELCKIGDYQDIIFKSKGNQLYDKDNINLIDGYYVGTSGTIVAGSNNKFNWVQLEPNKTYTLRQPIKSNVTVRIALFNSEPIPDFTGMIIGTFTETTPIIQTFTTTDTDIYLGWVYCNTANLNNHTQQEMLDSIMLNEGSTALPYEPYNSAGKWLLHKEIGKVVLNGSENWNQHGNIASWFYYDGIIDGYVLDNNQVFIKTNYYKPIEYNRVSSLVNGECAYGTSGIVHRFVIKNTDYTQVQDFKSWLSTHNTEVYYVLAISTTTEITDTELLAQLTLLSNATTYDETTNIFSNGDLPSILKVSATSIPTTTITNIGNIYAKPLLTIRGSGDISVYLNGIQLLQIALGDREEITIDISKMEAYDEETKVLLNRLVIGDYSKFLINSGVNELLITGDVSNFTISNYTRWL